MRIPFIHLKHEHVAQALRALQNRNYRLFFYGQGVSLIGTWLQQIALPLLTFDLTRSAFMLGLVGFLGQAPVLVIAPLAGVISDRVDRHRLLKITQVLAMAQALTLGVLTLGGWITVPLILVLSVAQGCVFAFDVPTRQAFLTQMLDRKEDLSNAVALNSSLVNLARMIGPAIGAVIIGLAGIGVCFLLNAVSYLAAIVALVKMRVNPQSIAKNKTSILHSLGDGFVYTFGFAPTRALMLLLACSSITGMSFTIIMPVFAKGVFGGDDGTYSFLMAFSGLGALIGGVYLAIRPGVRGLGKFLPIGATTLGLSMIGFAMTDWVPIAGLLRMVGSMGFVMQMAASNSILQATVDEERRGRVMAFYSMSFVGMAPLGALLGGTLAEHLGPRVMLVICGSLTLIAAAVMMTQFKRLHAMMLPRYEQLGL